LRRFHQQEAQQRVALLADMSNPSPISAGIPTRCQSQLACDLLATPKPFRAPDDQHETQRRQQPTPGCVLNRRAARNFSASCSMDCVGSVIVGLSSTGRIADTPASLICWCEKKEC
jgi:hypothetical protein